MNVQKQTDANSVEVSKLVRAQLAALEKQYSKEILIINFIISII